MRTSKIVSFGVVVILSVYGAIFLHALNAFSNRSVGATTASSGIVAQR
jgi:hypothetical protein